ncbi:MAG: hypothetical protein HC888_19890 [Candidatus Competibacteraceae bacterium]|nr:hypothetical protein [Candidatus Competibacteraceae bacterium]
MPATLDWRTASDYDYTATLDADGWAWEFLRRNQEYRADFEQCRAAERAASPAATELMEAASQRWGLRFPGRSRSDRRRSNGLLAA